LSDTVNSEEITVYLFDAADSDILT